MAGFSVGDHRAWRQGGAQGTTDGGVAQTGAGPGTTVDAAAPQVSTKGPSRGGGAATPALEARLGDLGMLALPARLHDAAFGRLRGGAFYHVVRFMLVLATVFLVVGGAQAESPVVHDVGDFRAVTPYTTLDAYPTPRFTYVYEIDVDQGQSPTPSAFFDLDQGTVRVPSFDGERSVYALYLNVVRIDDVQPVVMVKAPGGAYRTMTPASDDGVRMTFDPIRMEAAGSMGVLLASAQGSGNVDVQLAVAEAPVMERTLLSGARVGLIGGGVLLGVVLLGAYAPGAALLRERRARLAGDVDAVYAYHADRQPRRHDVGHARVGWGRPGVMAWKPPGKDAAEQLARLPGPGWVIRLD